MTRRRALALCAALLAGGAQAQVGVSGAPASSGFCDRQHPLTATQHDRLLRLAGAVRDELAASAGGAALVSRSGLDLSRFRIRYSHMAVASAGEREAWSVRQLYYACDEHQPRIFDQGIAGFVTGIDDPSLGFVSIVLLPADAARSLKAAALDTRTALHLLAARYSAIAYPFSRRYQNCNQWVAELLAVGWGGLQDSRDDGDGDTDGGELRERAQHWLRDAHYAPERVAVSPGLMFASLFVPLLHLDDHPADDRAALELRISLPAAIEAFVREQVPGSERVELCHDGHRIVVHRGWSPLADGCLPAEGDRVVPLD